MVFNQPHPGTSFLGIMHLQLVFSAVSVVMLSFMTISAQRCATIASPPILFLRPTVGSVGSKIQTGPRVSQWLHAWCSQIQRWSEVEKCLVCWWSITYKIIKQIKLEISNSSDIRTNKNHKKERKRLETARGAQRTSNIQICWSAKQTARCLAKALLRHLVIVSMIFYSSKCAKYFKRHVQCNNR